MQNHVHAIFPNENYLDFRPYQYGWEACAPLHSFGPFVRNHFLFHYIIQGSGILYSHAVNGEIHEYQLGKDQGFLICPGQINLYTADEKHPWEYVWIEFDGMRVKEFLQKAGLTQDTPIYRPRSKELGHKLCERMLYFSRRFIELIGSTPQEFLIQQRLTSAAELLRLTNLPIKNVADQCGYPNQLHFSQAFKKYYGVSPKEWRRQNS